MSGKQLIPLDKHRLSKSTAELEAFLLKHIRGQERPIRHVVAAYDQYCTDFRGHDRPILSMLSVGPSGAGKTLLAEMMAEFFFGNRSSFCKISCSSFSEPHKVSALIGSPPGYVGFIDRQRQDHVYTPYPLLSPWNIDKYDFFRTRGKSFQREIARLKIKAEKVKKELQKVLHDLSRISEQSNRFKELSSRYDELEKQYDEAQSAAEELGYNPDDEGYLSIVLFDELDRAHHTVHDIILEITDKAELSLSDGRVTRFHHTFLLMTANINARGISRLMKGARLGFQGEEGPDATDEQIYKTTMQEVERTFTAPFLGRLDSVVVFRPLTKPIIREIFDHQLARWQGELTQYFPILLRIDELVKDFLLKEATDRPEFGARLLKNKIQQHLKQWLSHLAASGQIKKGDIVHVKLQGDKEITFFKEELDKSEIVV